MDSLVSQRSLQKIINMKMMMITDCFPPSLITDGINDLKTALHSSGSSLCRPAQFNWSHVTSQSLQITTFSAGEEKNASLFNSFIQNS